MKTKTCPQGHSVLDLLTSMNKYWCFECRKFYSFPLKKGKKSVLIKGLTGE